MIIVQFYIILGLLILILIGIVAIMYEVFVDTDLKVLARNNLYKKRQLEGQVLDIQLQGGMEIPPEIEQQIHDKVAKEKKESKDSTNAIGFSVKRE